MQEAIIQTWFQLRWENVHNGRRFITDYWYPAGLSEEDRAQYREQCIRAGEVTGLKHIGRRDV
jgi:hypothetical protein